MYKRMAWTTSQRQRVDNGCLSGTPWVSCRRDFIGTLRYAAWGSQPNVWPSSTHEPFVSHQRGCWSMAEASQPRTGSVAGAGTRTGSIATAVRRCRLVNPASPQNYVARTASAAERRMSITSATHSSSTDGSSLTGRKAEKRERGGHQSVPTNSVGIVY